MTWRHAWALLGAFMTLLAVVDLVGGQWQAALHSGGWACSDFYIAMLLGDIERLRRCFGGGS